MTNTNSLMTTLIAGQFVTTEAGNSGMIVEIKSRGWVAVQLATGEVKNFQARTLTSAEQEDITKSEVEEMMEESTPSMLSTLINFKGEESPKSEKTVAGESIARKNGIVKAEYLQGYQKVVVERNGEKLRTFDNGDAVAVSLRLLTLEQTYTTVATTIGTDESTLHTKYAHLNPGQQKMCLSNLLRGFFKKIAEAQQ